MNDYRFGNLLTALREKEGLSQFQLGRIVGVSDKAVSKWENGRAMPRMEIFLKVSDALGISVENMMERRLEEGYKNGFL